MESYGTKPKRFSREWWPYFWYYYKWHTIGIAAVIIAVAVTCVQCASKEKFDFTIIYSGNRIFSEEQVDRFLAALEERLPDVDGDGVTNIDFQQLSLSGQSQNIEYDYAVQQKFDVALMSGENALYFMSEDEMLTQFARQQNEYVFVPIEDWAKSPVPKSAAVNKDGVPTGVNLENSAFLKETEFFTDDLYLAVRIKESGDKEIYQKRYDAACEAANILTEGLGE